MVCGGMPVSYFKSMQVSGNVQIVSVGACSWYSRALDCDRPVCFLLSLTFTVLSVNPDAFNLHCKTRLGGCSPDRQRCLAWHSCYLLSHESEVWIA